jgi:hypothetical protein
LSVFSSNSVAAQVQKRIRDIFPTSIEAVLDNHGLKSPGKDCSEIFDPKRNIPWTVRQSHEKVAEQALDLLRELISSEFYESYLNYMAKLDGDFIKKLRPKTASIAENDVLKHIRIVRQNKTGVWNKIAYFAEAAVTNGKFYTKEYRRRESHFTAMTNPLTEIWNKQRRDKKIISRKQPYEKIISSERLWDNDVRQGVKLMQAELPHILQLYARICGRNNDSIQCLIMAAACMLELYSQCVATIRANSDILKPFSISRGQPTDIHSAEFEQRERPD